MTTQRLCVCGPTVNFKKITKFSSSEPIHWYLAKIGRVFNACKCEIALIPVLQSSPATMWAGSPRPLVPLYGLMKSLELKWDGRHRRMSVSAVAGGWCLKQLIQVSIGKGRLPIWMIIMVTRCFHLWLEDSLEYVPAESKSRASQGENEIQWWEIGVCKKAMYLWYHTSSQC